MQKLIQLLMAPLKWLAGLLLPIFTRPRIPPAVYWILHVVLLAAVLGGLFYLHNYSSYAPDINKQMPEVGAQWLRNNYLVVFAVLIYLLSWVAVWLWKVWLEEDINLGQFPDIDEAWATIHEALRQNGIRLDDAPLFLVVGHAELPLDRLFKGLPRECALTGVTPATAPLRIFGGRDALYLACPGVSLLARALGFGSAGAEAGGMSAPLDATKTIGAEYDLGKSVGADAEEVAKIMRAVRQEGRGVTEDERHRIRNISMTEEESEGGLTLRPNVVQSPEAVSLQEARMKYFCQLLSKARWPYTPANGVALVFSTSATQNESDAQRIGLAASEDLKWLKEGLKLQFPVFVVLADLEKWSGAASFLARFPEDRRKNRIGRGFPLLPDISLAQYPQLAEREVQWIFDRLLPFWCFRFFRLETPNVESPEEAVQGNAEIFRFLAESQKRAGVIARMVAKAVQPDEESRPLFGGCYVVCHSGGQPWFTQDFFAKMEAAQDYVSWTQAAFDEDDDYRAWTWYGYGFLALVWLVLAGVAYFWIRRGSP